MNIIYGAGLTGIAILRICKQLGKTIDGFYDDNPMKCGQSIDGVRVYHTNTLLGHHHIIIAIPHLRDCIAKITKSSNNTWEDCIPYLANINFLHLSTIERYTIETCLAAHRAYYDKEIFLQNVDLVITEKCSLKCQDCSNLMPFYKNPETYDIIFLYEQIDRLCELVDNIYEIRVIGGEPLMNKNHDKIVRYILSKNNINRVIIYTNGTIDISPDKILSYKNNRVMFFITNYGKLSRRILELETTLRNNHIAYHIAEVGSWTDCGKVVPHHNNGYKLFQKCCARNTFTLLKGNLYRCPFAAHIANLELVDNQGDECNIFTTTKEQLQQYINLTYENGLSSCHRCKGRSYDMPLITPAIQVNDAHRNLC